MKNKITGLLFLLIFFLKLISIKADADILGCPVYRDGAVLGLNWHAGLIATNSILDDLPIYHVPNQYDGVERDSFSNFINENNFMGMYDYPNSIEHTSKELIVSMAARLSCYNVYYSLTKQLEYKSTVQEGSYIEPRDILSLRCDGLVEYCYEYYGFCVFVADDPDAWDISLATEAVTETHSLPHVTPKVQSKCFVRKTSYK